MVNAIVPICFKCDDISIARHDQSQDKIASPESVLPVGWDAYSAPALTMIYAVTLTIDALSARGILGINSCSASSFLLGCR
ncbi:protein of unknown function [Serratia sp. Tan611]|nr:protein of unknown function [Serratia sp. Tan611]